MTPSTFDSVLNLWKETPGMSFDSECDSKTGLSRFIRRNPGLCFVAHSDNTLAGAVLCGHDGRRGSIHHLAVSPTFQNMGIGKSLVDHCLKKLHKIHIPKCNILIFKSNVKARGFWKKTGWNVRQDLTLLQTLTDKV